MKKDWDTVEILRHTRHDWLNKIQLIKGNLSLNKIDRVKEIINEIVDETRQETKLSNLNIPQFAALLLTYNWESHSIHLEFEIIEDIHGSTSSYINDELLANWTIGFLEELDKSIKAFHENHLSVTIERQPSGIGFFFDFRGIITDIEQVQQFLQQQSSIENKVHELSEQELSLEVFLPYQ
ncbi:Spo0B C-terminal domain-containing protein [Robertmurraya kyonggiensis]|uniref:Sporulation protein n=1 Tax=Robertmurraya kyonggiensis TaxID=1037680 RepID=A0A4U1DDK7_9BACI|nr:Spo0B C-terminal domain-containing protein [Robertmurraya kyonggiensis]TKC20073.1 sporulation protein [Robertmurraya kyonggiensis]